MKKMKATLAIAMASVLTIGLVGCGSSSAPAATEQTSAAAGTDTTASAEATTTASGSDLNIMLETPVESLDPQQATDGTSFEVIADYTDGLMQMDADGQHDVCNIRKIYERLKEKDEDGRTPDLPIHSTFVMMLTGATVLLLLQQISYLHGREQQILKLLPNIPIC